MDNNTAFDSVNFYTVLGVSTEASSEEIKLAFKSQALNYHPDKNPLGSDEMMKAINAAYATLSNTKSRQLYDIKRYDLDDQNEKSFADFDDLKNYDIKKTGAKRSARSLDCGHKLSEEFIEKINFWQMSGRPRDEKIFRNPNISTSFSVCSIERDSSAIVPFNNSYMDYSHCKNRIARDSEAFLVIDKLLNGSDFVTSVHTGLAAAMPAKIWDWSFNKISIDLSILNLPAWEIPFFPLASNSVAPLQRETLDTKVVRAALSKKWIPFEFPNVDDIQQALFNENSNVSLGLFGILFGSKERHSEGTPIAICSDTLQMQSKLGYIPEHVVGKNSPKLVTDANQCLRCDNSFGLFLWSSNCMICGCAQCNDCLLIRKIPDYVEAVQICTSCEPKTVSKLEWTEPLKQAEVRKIVTPNYLAALDAMGFVDMAEFRKLSATFFDERRYNLAIQCNFSGNGSWLILADKFVNKNKYSYAKTCLDQIRIEPHDQIRNLNLKLKQMGDDCAYKNPILALLCYQRAGKLSESECIEKAIKFSNFLISQQLRKVTNIKNELTFYNSMCVELIKNKKYDLALFYMEVFIRYMGVYGSSLFKDSTLECINFINSVELDQAPRFIKLLNDKLPHWKKYPLRTDRDHLRWEYYSPPIFEVWFDYLSELLTRDPGTNCIPYFRSMMSNENFVVHRDTFMAKNQYIKMLICHCLIPNAISWEELGQKLRKTNGQASLAAYMCAYSDIEKLGDKLFAEGFKSLALRCYLQANSDCQILTQKLKDCENSKTRLLYQLHIFRKDPKNLINLKNLCDMLLVFNPEKKLALRNLIISIIRRSKKENNSDWYELLLKTDLSDVELLGIIELKKFNHSIQSYLPSLRAKFKEKLHRAILHSSLKDAFALYGLIHPLTQKIVDAVLKEFKIDSLERTSQKSVCLMIRAMSLINISPNARKLFQAMNDINEAILGDPTQDCLDFASALIEKISTLVPKKWLGGHEMIGLQNPVKNEFTHRFKHSPYLRVLIRSEDAIGKLKPFDAAMSYIDLCKALPTAPVMVGCFLSAAQALLTMQQEAKLSNENYAYRSAIAELVTTAYSIGNRTLCPATQLYNLRAGISILTSAFNNSQKISANNQVLIEVLCEEANRLAEVAPFVMGRMLQVYDLLYLDVINRDLMTSYLHKMRSSTDAVPKFQYYLFEGTWNGWIDEEKFKFEEERTSTMKALLKEKETTLNHVEDIMHWPLLARDEEGWLLDKPTPLQFSGNAFSRVDGMRFNSVTGEISFILHTSDSPMDNLFDMHDISDIMKLGIAGAQLTFEQPDPNLHFHPFQDVLYAPDCLSRTNYLGRMIHADMLLKMLSMRTEVSANAPFALRDATNLLKRMPPKLRQKFLELDMDDLPENAGRIHRFWIEAGELPYSETQEGNITTFKFGKCKMSVMKHLMERDRYGNLVDTAIDEEKNSKEAKFAKLMTDEFENLGQCFRELASLEQMAKLQAMSKIAQSIYAGLKKRIEKVPAKVTPLHIEVSLNEIRNQIQYPINTEDQVDDRFNEILRDNKISLRQVPDWQLYEFENLKNNIRSQLQEQDNKTVEMVKTYLSNNFHLHKWNISDQDMSDWLNYDYKNYLIPKLKNALINHQIEGLSRLCNTMNSAGIATSVNKSIKKDPCTWVPAAFQRGATHRVYGGVNMQARLTPTGNGAPAGGGGPIGGGASGRGYEYVVRCDAGGEITGTTTCVDAVTGKTYTPFHMKGSIKDQWNSTGIPIKNGKDGPDTQLFWKTRVGYTTTEEYSHHRSADTAHVHHLSGGFDCIRADGTRTFHNTRKRNHTCNK